MDRIGPADGEFIGCVFDVPGLSFVLHSDFAEQGCLRLSRWLKQTDTSMLLQTGAESSSEGISMMHSKVAGLALLFALWVGVSPGYLTRCSAQALRTNGAQREGDTRRSDAGRYTLPPDKLDRAITYSRARTTLAFVDEAWGALVLLLLLTTGAAAWMQRKAVSLGTNRWIQGSLFLLLLASVLTISALPISAYGHYLAVHYGQSVQRWPGWFGDQTKSFGLTYLFGLPVVMLFFVVVKRSPQRWWFWFWIPAVIIMVFGVFITPIFIDPLFNTFEPLAHSNPALVQQLERVVARGGIVIPPDRMFLMKASAKVTGLNAYVTGFGSSKRVVVWDTSIQKATPDQISFIFGHEMGHYVLNHIYIGLLFTAVLLLALFWLGFHGMQLLLARFGTRWGVSDSRDWGALVILLLVISAASFFAEPVANMFSRWEEHSADVYGQEAMHGILADPQRTGAETFQLLGEESLTDPSPNRFIEFWTFSHPSVSRRMAFAAAYNPWMENRSPRYFPK